MDFSNEGKLTRLGLGPFIQAVCYAIFTIGHKSTIKRLFPLLSRHLPLAVEIEL